MAGDLNGSIIAFLAAPEGTEQIELTDPWQAVEKAGGTPQLISTSPGEIQGFNHLDKGDTFAVDAPVEEVGADDFAGLVLPGGVANPDFLRTVPRAVAFTKEFFDKAKPVAAICHAPWLLVEAEAVAGRRLTSFPSLRTDIANAGGQWVDEQAVVCSQGPNKLVTSRKPDDLPAFDGALVSAFAG
ncbi:type 1 glutamine amidotransferase domain-containing protein [Streptomonospora wellingtoniae]|uniref:Type 1 glutamine amidotransferase domain-containing protein n=1 Tax=Streptomonospora wellingtoniae TaxID=3075544 RepID=A0ABU2KVU3_9ACTN|nr:type 1 glutamine amidotransferase domain-containing protein [Streptomonospora sp. DSM 45055]MDT0303407.1 type 1 glutamine amidotransferase domain-containing protein [Streptomonospora sp. DSM 45055]